MGCETTVKKDVRGGCDAAGMSLLGEGCCGGEFANEVGFGPVGGLPPVVSPAFAIVLGITVIVFVVVEGI